MPSYFKRIMIADGNEVHHLLAVPTFEFSRDHETDDQID